jgi:hypothetical protein
MPETTKRELARASVIALLVVGVSSVPYLVGYLSAAPGTVFGGFVVDLDDCASHLAKMQQGMWDGWTYRILFTPEDHPGATLNTFYVGLGKLSSGLGLSLLQTYQLARLACGFGLLLTAYLFIASFVEGRQKRLIAFLLVCLSSGLGWLVLLSGSPTLAGLSPIDFWLMEGYTFFTIFTFPHMAAAVALLLLFFLLALGYLGTPRIALLLSSVVTLLALCVIQPFMALPVDAALAAYWVLLVWARKKVPWREALALCTWGLAPLPLVIYYLRAFAIDPVFRSWSAQNILLSPPLIHLALGYGIVLALAILAAIFVIRQRDERRLFLVAWVTIGLLLMYAPFKLQRRMVEGLHVPLCVLATVGLVDSVAPAALRSRWMERISQWRGYEAEGLRRFLVFSAIAATLPSTLFLVADSSVRALDSGSALFYTTGEIEATDWLKYNTLRTDTVLASYEMGRLIPARAGNRVFMGHFIETVEVDRKKELAATFFQLQTSHCFRRELLEEYNVSYVFHGPAETRMGGFDPSEATYLSLSYRNDEVRVYRVLRLRLEPNDEQPCVSTNSFLAPNTTVVWGN